MVAHYLCAQVLPGAAGGHGTTQEYSARLVTVRTEMAVMALVTCPSVYFLPSSLHCLCFTTWFTGCDLCNNNEIMAFLFCLGTAVISATGI